MPELDLSLLMYGLMAGLAAGAAGGMLAGLAGIGGGLIYVPMFYICLSNSENAMATAIFASLVAIVITGFFTSCSHWRLGHVDRRIVKRLLPGLMIGASLGLWSTLQLPEAWILLALAGLNAWVALDYGRTLQPSPQAHTYLSFISGPIGFISGTLGIGGGTILVPVLRRSLLLRHAVGSACLCGFMMAMVAVLVNLSLEPNWQGLLIDPAPLLLGAWLGIAMILPTSTSFSARLHATIPEQTLRLTLKIIFMMLSAAMLIAAMLV